MTEHHTTLKHLGDVGASIATALTLVSQWAQLLTPILAFMIALATLVWWIIRFAEWFRTGDTGDNV